MRDAWRAGIVGVTHDGVTNVGGPAAFLEDAIADVGVFLRGRVALVVEIVEQGGGAVNVDESLRVAIRESEALGFLLTVGADAAFNGEGVLEQAGRLGELGEQSPSGFARGKKGGYLVSHSTSVSEEKRQYYRSLRVLWGALGIQALFHRNFHLT